MYSHKCHAREPCEHRGEIYLPSWIREKQSKEASHGRGSHRCESARMRGGAWERKCSVSGIRPCPFFKPAPLLVFCCLSGLSHLLKEICCSL